MIRLLTFVLLVGSTASAQLFPFPDFGSDAKPRSAASKLPVLNADSKAVSVSGISAGAYVATQLQIAFSTSIVGVGSVAGGPWNCAENDVMTAQSSCMSSTTQVSPKSLLQELKDVANDGKVDALDNLKSARVYLYNSPDDQVIREPMNAKTHEFYSALVNEANIKTETSLKSAHGFPTLNFGVACGTQAPPYMINCKFDVAGELLKHIYYDRALVRAAQFEKKSLISFDQDEFGGDSIMFADKGYAYVPQICRTAGAHCAVHVALHGCLQATENIKETFVDHAGYNEWAEGSNIIVIYPQAKSSFGNPNACFDWWGFTDENYANREGVQMKAIKAMIDRVTGS